MARVLLVLGFLAGLAAVLWLAWPRGAGPDPTGPLLEPALPATPGESPPPPLAPAAVLAPAPGAASTPPGPTWPVLPTDQIPRGGLDVTVLAPDGTPYPLEGVQVRLVRQGSDFYAEPLALPDASRKVFAFQGVPYGKVTVQVWGDHVQHATREADVPEGRTNAVEVFADRAGAIRYKAVLPDDTRPATVTLRLLPRRSRQALLVHFQTRLPDHLTSDVRATEATLPPEGIVFAVPPGSYRLVGTSAEGATTEVEVEVAENATSDVELFFRY